MSEEAPEPALPSPALAALAAAVPRFAERGPAPVHLWNPPFCGDIDMRIAADGTWFYAGTPIRRPALVRLFASILRRDPERYVLVTPVERVGITVEDEPFAAVSMEERAGSLVFLTSVGDEVAAGAGHPVRFDEGAAEGVKPAIRVRGDLWARLSRSLAYELLSRAEEREVAGTIKVGVRSGDAFFAIP